MNAGIFHQNTDLFPQKTDLFPKNTDLFPQNTNFFPQNTDLSKKIQISSFKIQTSSQNTNIFPPKYRPISPLKKKKNLSPKIFRMYCQPWQIIPRPQSRVNSRIQINHRHHSINMTEAGGGSFRYSQQYLSIRFGCWIRRDLISWGQRITSWRADFAVREIAGL